MECALSQLTLYWTTLVHLSPTCARLLGLIPKVQPHTKDYHGVYTLKAYFIERVHSNFTMYWTTLVRLSPTCMRLLGHSLHIWALREARLHPGSDKRVLCKNIFFYDSTTTGQKGEQNVQQSAQFSLKVINIFYLLTISIHCQIDRWQEYTKSSAKRLLSWSNTKF